jgi:sialic acid synthase SpsE
VFLEHQFAELAAKTAEDKILSAVQKTWKKMTEQARAKALELPLGEKEKKLIEKALGSA